MLKVFLIALAAGLVSALMISALTVNLFVSVLIAPFLPLPLFFVGLSLGPRPLLVAGGVAAVLAGMIFGSFLFSLFYAVILLAPAAILVRQALLNRPQPDGTSEWYPAGRLLAVLVVIMAAIFLLTAVFFSGQEGGIHGYATGQFADYIGTQIETLDEGEVPPGSVEEMASIFAFRAITGYPALLVLSMALCMLIAQFILSRMGKNTRPSFDLIDLQLPRWLTYALALSGALALFGPGQFKVIGTGLALAFAVPLFFLGLTVIHTYCRKIAAGFIVLILVYGILLFVPWIGAGLAGLGILEGWLKLRDRASGSS